MTLSRRLLLPVLFSALILPACGGETETPEGVTIYLVRHAEKLKAEDPGLTEAGKARAQALADRLKNERVDFIHSTDTRRTRATAQPLATAKDLEVEIYDGRDLLSIAEQIKIRPGTHVVVGHSNTTPPLAGLISGQVMDKMTETEYNRFTKVTLKASGELENIEVTTYGAD